MKNFIKNDTAHYYLASFEKLEKEKTFTWNWAAFFLGVEWLLYKKTYLCYMMVNITISIFVGSVAGIILNFLDASWSTRIESLFNVKGLLYLALLLRLTQSVVMVRYANSLYYGNLKKKIRRGYHLSGKYQPSNVFLVIVAFIPHFAPALLRQLNPHISFYALVNVQLCIYIFFFGSMFLTYLRDIHIVKKTANLGAFDNAVNKENLRTLISPKKPNGARKIAKISSASR
ncbi:MAG: DUF2628 domain-containing protein [Holosporaceae bacterium]|jgi:hypothetical protein|nr:DUF2628 domain-containing protein [Holosporaceae bacterium]